MLTLICVDNAVDVYDTHPANGEPVYLGTLDETDVVYGVQFAYDYLDQKDAISPDVPGSLRDAWSRFVQYVFDTHDVEGYVPDVVMFYDQRTGEQKSLVQLIQEAQDFFLPVADVIFSDATNGGDNERG
jgi:hypothetical protein